MELDGMYIIWSVCVMNVMDWGDHISEAWSE